MVSALLIWRGCWLRKPRPSTAAGNSHSKILKHDSSREITTAFQEATCYCWQMGGKESDQLFRICYVNVPSCVLLLQCMWHDHKWCLMVLRASWFYESNEPFQNWYCFPGAGNIRQSPGKNLNGWAMGFEYFLLSDSRGSICCILDLLRSPASYLYWTTKDTKCCLAKKKSES